ncbi:hypothetical protein B1810_16545 [Panacagrimonas perspica]|uniref:MbcA/ParS/Xre antitoxin family protein n=1 Tax=Panacagrimonas perspica TaxID=381431 RepID=UPI001061BB6F|nr:hypothetical protein B1810_16545 [Panacagrimonas perspica]
MVTDTKQLRLVRDRAREVFEDEKAASDWLESPNRALGGDVPQNILESERGLESVLRALTAIEHGLPL